MINVINSIAYRKRSYAVKKRPSNITIDQCVRWEIGLLERHLKTVNLYIFNRIESIIIFRYCYKFVISALNIYIYLYKVTSTSKQHFGIKAYLWPFIIIRLTKTHSYWHIWPISLMLAHYLVTFKVDLFIYLLYSFYLLHFK